MGINKLDFYSYNKISSFNLGIIQSKTDKNIYEALIMVYNNDSIIFNGYAYNLGLTSYQYTRTIYE